MTKWLLSLLICSALYGCCEECHEDEPLRTLDAETLITELAGLDYIVNVDGDDVSIGGEVVALAGDIMQKKSAIVVCDPFGWGKDYDWLCTMNGTKGRAIANLSLTPSSGDFACYIESGSQQYPGDITSTTYFNKNTYPNYDDTDVGYSTLRTDVSGWGTGWNSARVTWCTVDNPDLCVQD